MDPWSLVFALTGGALIGLASILVLKTRGRIAGVSGICGSLLRPSQGDISWRLAFTVGLAAAGGLSLWLAPSRVDAAGVPAPAFVALAGLLVGFGTRLGNGCTSGHGVCGVARLSKRSLVATATFMASGALTVFLVRHVMGGP